MSKRVYTEDELCELMAESDDDELSSLEDQDSEDEYEPDSDESDDSSDIGGELPTEVNNIDEEVSTHSNCCELPQSSGTNVIIWSTPNELFIPRLKITEDRPTIVLSNLNNESDEMECFLKIFPRSLIMFISQCTNLRLDLLRKKKKTPVVENTDPGEIMMVLGCMLVMSYNKVPNLSDYWSHNPSMGNEAIKLAISRNRCLLLLSKLYFNDPQKPDNCSKTYYIDEVMNCFKYTFPKARSESPFQSIDESMTKFKGRSSLKQYLPLKPIKRGIKIWERCDSKTGYAYDLNIYSGKETDASIPANTISLGEKVVLTLAKTIRNQNVTLVFDRFFTSVHLLNTISYPSLGTAITSRKNMPKFDGKLKKGESQFVANEQGTIAVRWQDSRDVLLLSNCHDATVSTTRRRQKDGNKLAIDCPSLICFYNKYMGGVDLSDQKVSVYGFDRRS